MTRKLFGLHLFLLRGPQSSGTVGEADVELRGTLDDELPLLRRHVVSDLGAVLSIVHEQELQVLTELVTSSVSGLENLLPVIGQPENRAGETNNVI